MPRLKAEVVEARKARVFQLLKEGKTPEETNDILTDETQMRMGADTLAKWHAEYLKNQPKPEGAAPIPSAPVIAPQNVIPKAPEVKVAPLMIRDAKCGYCEKEMQIPVVERPSRSLPLCLDCRKLGIIAIIPHK